MSYVQPQDQQHACIVDHDISLLLLLWMMLLKRKKKRKKRTWHEEKKMDLELVGVVERKLPLLLLLMSEAVLDIVDYIFNHQKVVEELFRHEGLCVSFRC